MEHNTQIYICQQQRGKALPSPFETPNRPKELGETQGPNTARPERSRRSILGQGAIQLQEETPFVHSPHGPDVCGELRRLHKTVDTATVVVGRARHVQPAPGRILSVIVGIRDRISIESLNWRNADANVASHGRVYSLEAVRRKNININDQTVYGEGVNSRRIRQEVDGDDCSNDHRINYRIWPS